MTEKEWRRRFSERLSLALECRDLSQSDFAKCVGTTRQQINDYIREKSSPSVKTLLGMCNVLECTMSDLVDMEKPSKLIKRPVKKQVAYFKMSTLFRGSIFNEATYASIPGTPLMDENRNRVGIIESLDPDNDRAKVVFDNTPIAKKFIADLKEQKKRSMEIVREWEGAL